MPDAIIAHRLRIHGRVQGVSYRASAAAEARRLGLHGWVRNRRDGTVEAVVAGAPEAVEYFLAWARQGPPNALVSRIETETADLPDPGFAVAPDA